jgi:hypothetical protein
MSKKLFSIVCLFVLLGCANNVLAAENTWIGGLGGNLWSYGDNWSSFSPPSAGMDAKISSAANPCIIDSTVTAQASTVYVGYLAIGNLTITGGTLSSGLRVGSEGGGIGTVAISGGAVTLNTDSAVGQYTANGTITMTGGSINQTAGWMYVGFNGGTGHITLSGNSTATFGGFRGWNGGITVNGNTLTINGDTTLGEGVATNAFDMTINGGTVNQSAGALFVGYQSPGGVHLNGGLLSINNLIMDGSAGEYFDIKPDATLKIKDARPTEIAYQINSYAGNGWLTVNGGQNAVGNLNITTEAGTNYTIVTAIPPVCWPIPKYDFNGDCKVNFADFAMFATEWLVCNKTDGTCP